MTKQFNILVEIKPTAIDDFVDWQANFNTAIGHAPGLISLENWLQSPERNAVLQESLPLISSLVSHHVISPYSGWFASISKTGVQPPLWKQTLLILLVLFPIVMFEMKYLSPLTKNLNPALGMFIGNAISVALISFPMLPLAIHFLKWWLTTSSITTTFLGTGVVVLLYLIELAFFWNYVTLA